MWTKLWTKLVISDSVGQKLPFWTTHLSGVCWW